MAPEVKTAKNSKLPKLSSTTKLFTFQSECPDPLNCALGSGFSLVLHVLLGTWHYL
jgi:hypothetical protein